jgi:hypothetical protein
MFPAAFDPSWLGSAFCKFVLTSDWIRSGTRFSEGRRDASIVVPIALEIQAFGAASRWYEYCHQCLTMTQTFEKSQ